MWQVYAASAQGTSHIHRDIPCQDAYHYEILEPYMMVAIADGLGSATRADEGAQLAVKHALTYLKKTLASPSTTTYQQHDLEKMITHAFADAKDALLKAAKRENTTLHDYATTLLVAVLSPNGLVAGQVGDGVMVALLEDQSLWLVNTPQRGEYINETIPLTADNSLTSLSLSSYQGKIQALASLTDGLQDLALNLRSEIPFAPFFQPFFQKALCSSFNAEEASQQLADFLASERVCNHTSDDKTLVIAGRV